MNATWVAVLEAVINLLIKLFQHNSTLTQQNPTQPNTTPTQPNTNK